MSLIDIIRQRIQTHGPMPFHEFMERALYTAHLGYYSSSLPKLGKHGDFITAPELTPLFAYTLANEFAPILKTFEQPVLFEFGAGSGQFCVDILTKLEEKQALPDAYHILDVSEGLKHQQQTLIKEKIPHLIDRIAWLSAWPTETFSGIIIVNEVLDAMPVHAFLYTSEGLMEKHVTLNEQGDLEFTYLLCQNERMLAHFESIAPYIQPTYQSEMNLSLAGWMQQCYAMLEKGGLFIIDYGFPRHEYYHPERNQGTVMCHYQHRAHANPLIHLGEQDITAHVDFTHVAEAGDSAGFHVAGYTNQAAFLLANGLLSLLSDRPNDNASQQAVKQLIQPHEMGELFKVMALTKNLNMPLMGFNRYDKRASL